MKYILLASVLILFSLSLVSAVTVNNVNADDLSPGKEGRVALEVENILTEDVEEVSVRLLFEDLPIIPIGSSEQSTDEINEGDEENFIFTVKASSTATPGDYEIPYVIEYKTSGSSQVQTKSGSIGIKIISNPVLDFSVSAENPLIEEQGTINLKIVNKGFSDARFVSIRAIPSGFNLISEEKVYIGTIDSDDFETASFETFFTKTNPKFEAIVEYTNFENEKITQTIDLPFEIYTKKEAQELGIIKPNYLPIYLSSIVVILLLIYLIRLFRKRQKLKTRVVQK